jgi:hypothetical protein
MCTKDQTELKEVKRQIVHLNRKIQKVTDKIYGNITNAVWLNF